MRRFAHTDDGVRVGSVLTLLSGKKVYVHRINRARRIANKWYVSEEPYVEGVAINTGVWYGRHMFEELRREEEE